MRATEDAPAVGASCSWTPLEGMCCCAVQQLVSGTMCAQITMEAF